MKKEYFLLIIAIIALSAYLFFNNQNQSSYLLPEIEKIDKAEIDHVEITKDNKTIECFKDNGKWVVTQNKFLGNEQTISEIIASISNLTITTLISEKKDLKRYDLEKEKAIKVTAKSKNKTLREFSIGKTAPTQKHTFVTLDNNNDNKKNVFHASGNLQRMFNKTVDNLRDKQIQKFDKESIKSMEISKGDLKKTILKIELQAAKDLRETLSDFKCSSYIEDQTKADYKNKTSILTIKLATEIADDQAYEITIFPKTEQNKYIGISSKNDYLFILENYIADDIISNTDKLLNIKPEKANEKNS